MIKFGLELARSVDKAQPLRHNSIRWKGRRVAEGSTLLRECRVIPYRGFESLSLRHLHPY